MALNFDVMSRSMDNTNTSVSIVRVVSDALVQEPAGWRSFIDMGVDRAKNFGADNVGYQALEAMKAVFEATFEQQGSAPSRSTIQEIAEKFVRNADGTVQTARFSEPMTPKLLAGQSLLLSLRH